MHPRCLPIDAKLKAQIYIVYQHKSSICEKWSKKEKKVKFDIDINLSYSATILVNRGWIPKNKDERKLYKRPETQPEGEVEIVGVVRTDEKKNSFTPKNNAAHNLWYYRDIEEIAKNLGTVPVYIDANLASTVRGGPIGGQTVVKLHNDHVSYIITW
ncbi:SURF1 [Mytilus coruscus]|uniref:SURF1-like protein n=1 Tax=Mytilus coruscus TaxID=42192 RepID=A0A6J8C5J5_MYTCO|nr:SURF1 [Mytilus coruscus]